jgi:hypothetical protein
MYTLGGVVAGAGVDGCVDRLGATVVGPLPEAHADAPVAAVTARTARTTRRTRTLSSLFDLPDQPESEPSVVNGAVGESPVGVLVRSVRRFHDVDPGRS